MSHKKTAVMRKHNIPLPAVALVAAMATVLSCQKDPYYKSNSIYNPPVKDLQAGAFTLSAVETRSTEVELPWTISADGRTDSVKEKVDQMCATSLNSLTLTVKGAEVNVRSTNTTAVRIAPLGPDADGNATYAITYAGDGEAAIEVWNGSKSGERRVSFPVTGVKDIPPTAVVYIMDEGTDMEKEIRVTKLFTNITEFQSHCSSTTNNEWDIFLPYEEMAWDHDKRKATEPKVMHSVRFDRLEPENTSYRYVLFNTVDYFTRVDSYPIFLDYLDSHGYEYNWRDEYSGDYSGLERNYFVSNAGACDWYVPLCKLYIYQLDPKRVYVNTALTFRMDWRVTLR